MTTTDLLYLDRKRLRRLLGELEGGVVESVVNQIRETAGMRATARLFADEGQAGDSRSAPALDETISLDDALLQISEEAFERSGVLHSVERLRDPREWLSPAGARDQLRPAQLVSLRAIGQIVDPRFFADSVDRLMQAVESMGVVVAAQQPSPQLPNQRGQGPKKNLEKAAAAQAAVALLDGLAPDTAREIGKMVPLFYGDQIALRQLPCGVEHRDFALTGILNADDGSLLETRPALYAKYGAAPTEWTVISQIAAVPANDVDVVSDSVEDDDEDSFTRGKLEAFATEMMVALEMAGVSGAPRWPTVTVTPLAVYRRSE